MLPRSARGLFTGSSILVLVTLLSQSFGGLAVFLMGQKMPLRDFAAYAVFVSMTAMVTFLSDMGLNDAFISIAAKKDADKLAGKLIAVFIAFRLLLAILAVSFVMVATMLIGRYELYLVLLMGLTVFFVALESIPLSISRQQGDISVLAVGYILPGSLVLVGVILSLSLWEELRIFLLLALLVSMHGIFLLVLCYLSFSRATIASSIGDIRQDTQRLMALFSWMAIGYALHPIIFLADVIIAGIFEPSEKFASAFGLVFLITAMTSAVTIVPVVHIVFPKFQKARKNSAFHEYARIMQGLTIIIFLCLIPLSFLLQLGLFILFPRIEATENLFLVYFFSHVFASVESALAGTYLISRRRIKVQAGIYILATIVYTLLLLGVVLGSANVQFWIWLLSGFRLILALGFITAVIFDASQLPSSVPTAAKSIRNSS
ncbi:MAG: oligosaccharide flippase family protein [Candidatus Heimdallarchaeota archaeon]